MTAHGLVIGKFYPLHAGHLGLVRFAASESAALTVIVLGTVFESGSHERRADWLRAELAAAGAELGHVEVLAVRCDAPEEYGTEIAWVANVAIMRAALAAAGRPAPTAVFSSEPYGVELAARFGAEHRAYDVAREGHPISGTAIRADLAGRWSEVAPAARLDLATRVIVTGAESTGTTTLTTALVDHYRANGFAAMPVVPEYGRDFTYELHAETEERLGREVAMDDLVWLPEHFARIAERQNELEDAAAMACPLVIADTDAFATELWERRYLGATSDETHRFGTDRLPPRDVYLVTDHVGVPFFQDGWRDGEHIRADMNGWFVDELTRRDASWVLLRGAPEERLRYAVRLIDALWARNATFASPPWRSSPPSVE
ncbi:AAA family ATPase [Agromyces sp. MMS24-K17]|uniref:AAA family ATPase n=1 Tax=Agromyces sp. MMS24-K17 TaxID=3372850 RepID=UPI003754A722